MLRIAITDGSVHRRSTQIGIRAAVAELVERVRMLAARTDRNSFPQDKIDYVVLREKELADDDLAEAARQITRALAAIPTRLLVAGSVEIALSAGAHGVHLPADGDIAEVCTHFPAGYLTISCHTLEEVRAARDGGVSAILFAPVFGKNAGGIEVMPGTGLGLLREACQLAAPVPVVALGGITEANAQSVVDAGAAGIAAIRLFFPPQM